MDPKLVPLAWMGAGRLVRVVLHWTAGSNYPSAEDKQAYHLLIDRVGHIHRGDHAITDNVNCADDDYAAHTRGLNTGSIGVAICGMAGANERPFAPGPYPIKPAQWTAALIACADLCRRYRVKPEPKTLLMHCEVEKTLGIRQAGKWDVGVRGEMWTPPAKYAAMTPGEELRARVKILLAEEE